MHAMIPATRDRVPSDEDAGQIARVDLSPDHGIVGDDRVGRTPHPDRCVSREAIDHGVGPSGGSDATIKDHAGRLGLKHEGISKDRKSTRLNSSHLVISYAVFCLKKKNNKSTKIC